MDNYQKKEENKVAIAAERKNKKEIRCYNVIFPLWFLLFLPSAWLLLLPGNFIIDSIILLLACLVLKIDDKWAVYKKTILGVWGFGFLSDIIASGFLLTSQLSLGDWWQTHITVPVINNPWDNFAAICFVLISVIIAAVCIYFLNYKLLFQKLFPGQNRAKHLCLILAICTAPYFFFVPTQLFYEDWSTVIANRGDKGVISDQTVAYHMEGTLYHNQGEGLQPVTKIPGAELNKLNMILQKGEKTEPPKEETVTLDWQIGYVPWEGDSEETVVSLGFRENQLLFSLGDKWYVLDGEGENNLLSVLARLESGAVITNGWRICHWESAEEKQFLFTDRNGNYYLYETDGKETMLSSPDGKEYSLIEAVETGALSIKDLLTMGFDVRLQVVQ